MKRGFFAVVVCLVLSMSSLAANNLPVPNHPLDFGYFFSDFKVNRFNSEVFWYTDLYVATPMAYDTALDWFPELQASMAQAANAGKKIYFLPSVYQDGTCGTPRSHPTREITWDSILAAVTPYWGAVKYIEIMHEGDCTPEELDGYINLMNAELDQRGLSHKLVSIMQTSAQAASPNHDDRQAIFLDVVGIEAYFTVGVTQTAVNEFIAQAKSNVPLGKSIVLVAQAYDMKSNEPLVCPHATDWRCHLAALGELQEWTYLNVYNDTRVSALLLFAYARQYPQVATAPCTTAEPPQPCSGGARVWPEIKLPHRWMAERIFGRCVVNCEADYNQDSIAELSLYRSSTNTWYSLQSASYTTTTATQCGTAWDRRLPGDYDGDGREDPAVYNPLNHVWTMCFSGGGTGALTFGGWAIETQVPEDFDGDGRTDPTVFYRVPYTGTYLWEVRLSSTSYATYLGMSWGQSGAVPFPADFDGDGRADFAYIQGARGNPNLTWNVSFSRFNYTTSAAYQFGQPGDVPLRGDFDGDARQDLAMFRPTTGLWTIRYSSNGFVSGMDLTGFSVAGDIPVPADYNGDKKTEAAFYRPSTMTFHIYGNPTPIAFGMPGDQPVKR